MELNRNVIDGHADGFKRHEMEKKIGADRQEEITDGTKIINDQ